MLVSFIAGRTGRWSIRSLSTVCGASLERAEFVDVAESSGVTPPETAWCLRGVVSHSRYTTRKEALALASLQPPLGRAEATCGAMIPIKKSAQWWALAQDERRAIYEESSRHTSIGIEYLPRIARRLHYSRDLGEPFDFVTWFEFSPEHEPAFDELLSRLRASEEWGYVEREVDIRLMRASS